jgi:hypothetical protein
VRRVFAVTAGRVRTAAATRFLDHLDRAAATL